MVKLIKFGMDLFKLNFNIKYADTKLGFGFLSLLKGQSFPVLLVFFY